MAMTEAQVVYLTAQETANLLRLPVRTLYAWRARRPRFGPPATKVGKHLRYRSDHVEDWLRRQREMAETS